MLAAFAPLQTRAAVNTWNNGSADFLWNTTSLNWAAPTTWVQGDDAIFGVTGAGTVTLGEDINVTNMTFNANYIINAAGKFSTNSIITAGAGLRECKLPENTAIAEREVTVAREVQAAAVQVDRAAGVHQNPTAATVV